MKSLRADRVKPMLSQQNICRVLRQCGITEHDAVMIHSSYSSIGLIESGPEGFIQAIESLVGEHGTIVMPVYNWDILHQGDTIVYDEQSTQSRMGYLTEYFRTRDKTKITQHVFNPLAVKGSLENTLLERPNISCWGTDSCFQELYDQNAVIIMVGTDFNAVTMFHVAETRAQVPYRYLHTFKNCFFKTRDGQTIPLRNTTLRRHDGYPTDFNVAGKLLEKEGIVAQTVLGDAIVRIFRSRPFVDKLHAMLLEKPDLLIKKTLSRQWIPTRKPGVYHPTDFIHQLWLKNRALISDDYDESLEEIASHIPLRITETPSNYRPWNWTVPQKWSCRGGSIRRATGECIFDLGRHPLMIAAGSNRFDGRITHRDLLNHIKSDPLRPDAIPYHTCYYSDTWAICLPHRDLDTLQDNAYLIQLNCEKSNGSLKIGECIIEGKTTDSIIFPLHLDHPGQCNDNLSGVSTAISIIMDIMQSGRQLNHTLRFVFLPETIGIITYLNANASLIPRIKWGIVFDSIGTSSNLMYMQTVSGTTRLDLCARQALSKHCTDFREYAFLSLQGYGNDERALQAPGIDIPSISLSRFPYQEYHSSLDCPDIISTRKLKEAKKVILEMIRTIDLDFIPQRQYEGIPQLSKIPALHKLFAGNPDAKQALHKTFFYLDNRHSVLDIADKTDMPFDFTYSIMSDLLDSGLIAAQPYSRNAPGSTALRDC